MKAATLRRYGAVSEPVAREMARGALRRSSGGVAVAIAHELKLPIRYIGVGEGIDDLVPFDPDDYVQALFAEQW